eukprot:8965034-Lingulodinium_polyedra.AAC.1
MGSATASMASSASPMGSSTTSIARQGSSGSASGSPMGSTSVGRALFGGVDGIELMDSACAHAVASVTCIV